MAAPADMTTQNISGKFRMNKSISDNIEEILVLQGVGWIKRKAIVTATITLAIKHVKEDDVETIDIDQTLTGGIPGTAEHRELTWVERPHEDHIFGAVVGKSRRVQLSTLTEEGRDEYLTTGWTEDTKEHGAIESYVESDTPKSGTTWIANQIWGFEVINDERRYSRHIHFTGPKGEIITARMAYDYIGAL